LLLILAPVMLDLMEGVFELAGFKGIELGFGHADFTDQDLEVGRLGVALDEGGKSELLEWHRIPPGPSIAKDQSSAGNSWSCGKRIVKNPLRRLEMACYGPGFNHPGRATALIAQRECSVDLGAHCDQRELVLGQFARLADGYRSYVVAEVQGRIALGHDSNRKQHLVTSFDTFPQAGFLKSIVILPRPQAALGYDAPAGRLARQPSIAVGFFLDSRLRFLAAPFRLGYRGIRESNDIINRFHLELLHWGEIQKACFCFERFQNMKIRVQISLRIETRIAWEPVQGTTLVAALDFAVFIALRRAQNLSAFYSIFVYLTKDLYKDIPPLQRTHPVPQP
jgi:hypothetical protein